MIDLAEGLDDLNTEFPIEEITLQGEHTIFYRPDVHITPVNAEHVRCAHRLAEKGISLIGLEGHTEIIDETYIRKSFEVLRDSGTEHQFQKNGRLFLGHKPTTIETIDDFISMIPLLGLYKEFTLFGLEPNPPMLNYLSQTNELCLNQYSNGLMPEEEIEHYISTVVQGMTEGSEKKFFIQEPPSSLLELLNQRNQQPSNTSQRRELNYQLLLNLTQNFSHQRSLQAVRIAKRKMQDTNSPSMLMIYGSGHSLGIRSECERQGIGYVGFKPPKIANPEYALKLLRKGCA